jgi:hypothetical protein
VPPISGDHARRPGAAIIADCNVLSREAAQHANASFRSRVARQTQTIFVNCIVRFPMVTAPSARPLHEVIYVVHHFFGSITWGIETKECIL